VHVPSRQFVLIDHSIEDAAGHHLEYARRVLGAAKAEGFRTVLAVNRRARRLDCPEADAVFKSFSQTCWEMHAQPVHRTLVGFALRRGSMTADPLKVIRFATELASLVAEAGLTEADIVFVPTLGGPEALAIAAYSTSEGAQPLHWHLLFRRDVAPCASLTKPRETIARWCIRSALDRAARQFRAGVRYLYTDTEELTQRYNSLCTGSFQTLPIPIDERLGLKRPHGGIGPLVVSYVGDMRDEKGIDLLPGIIESVRRAGHDKARVLFRIQGNLPVTGATSKTRHVKEALQGASQSGVELVDGPLSSDAYMDQMLHSDVVLIPYSPIHYAARSSGVFVEAVAAGIPTVHPRASWMGRNAMDQQGFGYSTPSDIAEGLNDIIVNYPRYEAASRRHIPRWREWHSANRLISLLRANEKS
jgi:glycosyltransferase involved in cell wall biosynthesis